jgi:threo-3-hydroxy-L-aspartate ammonia-lyase
VTFDDILDAQTLLKGNAVRTPFLFAPTLSDLTGANVYVKLENQQVTSSFKDRGAYVKLASLDEAERRRGVVTMSAGNHAQAVAYHAGRLGIPATIVMPETTPFTKVERTRGHGAEVVLSGETLADSQVTAEALVADKDLVLVHPYDDDRIIAGQGTIGLEIADDLPDVDNVLVPVSGGGLASGIGTAIRALCPGAKVFGVEPELAAETAEALRLGHRVDWPIERRNRTIADGLRSQPSELTFAHLQQVLDDVFTVTEDEITDAVRELAFRAHLVAEPSGAVGLAAHRRRVTPPGRTVVVVSGGNIEPAALQQILAG